MPAASRYPSIDFPDVDLWTFLFERKDQYVSDKVIFRDPYTSRSYTYAETRATALTFGNGLKSQFEWRKNDVLALFTPNCIDTPAVMWGAHWAGGIVSPANPAYSAEELGVQLADCGARLLVTQWPLLHTAREAAQKVGIPDDHIVLIGDAKDPKGRFKHFSSVRNISGATKYRRAKIDPDKDLAFLVYSSGTTGLPKGVMLSHRNIVANTLQINAAETGHLTMNDKILAFLPFFHIYGLTVILHQSMYRGYEVVVMPRFDMQDFCRFVQEHKITFSYVAPPVILGLSKDPMIDEYDLSSIRMLNSGAAPLTRDLVEALWKRKSLRVKQGYGLSETSPTTHTQPWESWLSTVGSVGTLLPNMTAKYMSPDETEVAIGQTGELWLKGPNIFKGYLKNHKSTANALTADGYFKTGDVGHQDVQGNFYITDRVKELIKYKGFQVAPAELEGYLAAHDKVADVAVIGIYRKDLATEVPRAYVVANAGITADHALEKELVEWLSAKVATHKRRAAEYALSRRFRNQQVERSCEECSRQRPIRMI